MENQTRNPSFLASTFILLFIVAILAVSILYYQVAPQIPIVLAATIVGLYAYTLGYRWKDLEEAMVKGISAGLPSVLILMTVGILIGVWALNGTVPTLAFYGLNLLSPQFFLVSAVILCVIVSIMAGSSWSAISTMGVALMGVAYGMGISPAMTAGAIVCGAIFGDKISPLSDTTNLTSAIAKVNIFEHIRYMLWTTIPALLITLVIFLFIGLDSRLVNPDSVQMDLMVQTLEEQFTLSWLTLLSPLAIVILGMKRVPALPTMFISLLIAILTGLYTISNFSIAEIMVTAHTGYVANTGVEAIDNLLSIGGLSNMLFGVSIILIALSFGGLVQMIGLHIVLLNGMVHFLKRTGNIVLTTVFACIGVNTVIGEQYLSIMLPGQMLESTYKKANLHPKTLSRTLEDAGTVVHPAIPWGVTGAFIMSTLNIGVEYALFSFMCFITPLIAIFYGYTGISIKHIEEDRGDSVAQNVKEKKMPV